MLRRQATVNRRSSWTFLGIRRPTIRSPSNWTPSACCPMRSRTTACPVIRQVFITNSTGRRSRASAWTSTSRTVDGVLNQPFRNEIGAAGSRSHAGLHGEPAARSGPAGRSGGTASGHHQRPPDAPGRCRLARVDEQIRVLAHNHWIVERLNQQLSYEAIAAYVMPNHPSVPDLLTTAHEIIGRRTGSTVAAGLSGGHRQPGNQSAQRRHRRGDLRRDGGPGHQLHQPAGQLGRGGQKIRTPQQVLRGCRAPAWTRPSSWPRLSSRPGLPLRRHRSGPCVRRLLPWRGCEELGTDQ